MSSPNADFASARADCSAAAISAFLPHHPHAASAAAGRGLQNDRIADVAGKAVRFGVGADAAVGARHDGNAKVTGGAFGGDLVAHQANVLRTRADEVHIVLAEDFGKTRILRKKAVAGMHGIGAGYLAGGQQRRNIEVAVFGGGRTDANALVGQAHVHGVFVGRRMHRDRGNAEFLACTQHPQCDLSSVGDEDLVEHYGGSARHHSMIISGSPNSTGWPSSMRTCTTVPARGEGI